MLNKVLMFGAVCDECGEIWRDDHNGFVAFRDKMSIELNIQESGWHTHESTGETYCLKCHIIGDDDELIVIKRPAAPIGAGTNGESKADSGQAAQL